jgi:hypothetical protein
MSLIKLQAFGDVGCTFGIASEVSFPIISNNFFDANHFQSVFKTFCLVS